MIDQMTINKLHEMHLNSMAEAYHEQLKDQSLAGLTFEERFGLLVDTEWSRRKNNRLTRLIQNAGLSQTSACLENIEYSDDRKLDKAQISRLAACSYIQEKHNIIILGAAGAGKSYLANALGIAACRNFFSVKYIRIPDLIEDLSVARGEGDYKKALTAYKNINLLILDEWMLVPLAYLEARDLLELVDGRYKRGSTIYVSQFSPQGWHTKIGDTTLADAILDRIIHDSHIIQIEGKESMRKKKGIKSY